MNLLADHDVSHHIAHALAAMALQRARRMTLETIVALRDDVTLPATAAGTRAAQLATKIPAAQLLRSSWDPTGCGQRIEVRP